MKKNHAEHLAFSIHSRLLRWFFTICGAGETKYAQKTPKTGKLPINSHFRSQAINLLLCYIITFNAQTKTGNCPKTEFSLNNKSAHWLTQSDSCSYFSVLLCCGVRWASDPSLLTDAATVDIVSASSLLLWCSAIKASSCFLLCRNSSLKISCLLISDHNCLQ